MRQVGIWFLLSCKRYLKKLSFVLILLVLPLAAYFLREVEKEEGQEVRIAVYAEQEALSDAEERPLEQMLAESLWDRGDGGLFRFYLCGSEEQVKEEVASRRAECGYVISADLRRKLDQKNYRRCIRVYSAPSTVLASLSTEVVAAVLMKLYDREIFLDYIIESETVGRAVSGLNVSELNVSGLNVFDNSAGIVGGLAAGAAGMGESGDVAGEILRRRAGELYDKWMGNGSTFRFEYGYRGLQAQTEGEQQPHVFPVRGIAAVYLLVVGLYSAVMVGSDQARGLFLPLPGIQRQLCGLAALAAPVFLAALSALGALKTGGCLQEPGREAVVMGIYLAAVCIFSLVMKNVCRKPQVLCCVIPVFLVGSLIFTPVLVDIRQFFPALGWIEKLFLPSYYLRAFY